MSKTYSVICQHVIGNSYAGFSVVYADDGQRFENREAAIVHGFKQGRSDDFNVGVYDAGKLVSIDWMNEPVDTDPDRLHRVQHEREIRVQMSTEKSTPGPWSVIPRDETPGHREPVMVDTGQGLWEPKSDRNPEPNANLIAAAPDLLASAKDAISMLKTVEVIDGQDGDPWSKAMARMEAAIVKAEGR